MMNAKLHYCSCPVRTALEVTENRSQDPLQKSDYVEAWLHQRLCETESRAHSGTETDIVVILH